MVLRIAALRGSRCLGSYTFTVLEAEAEGRAGEMESLRGVVTLDTDAEQVIEACSRSGFLADARSEP